MTPRDADGLAQGQADSNNSHIKLARPTVTAVRPTWETPGFEHLRPPPCAVCGQEHYCGRCGQLHHDCSESPRRRAAADPAESLSRTDQLRAALLDSAGLDSLPDPQPVIDGILYRDTLAWLHGKPGCGKSFVALDWAGCISTGLPWQMHDVKQGPVLYVIAEGVTGLRQRVRAWEDHAQCRMGAQFLPVAAQFLDPVDLAAVIALASEIKPILIVLDTQARVTVGADENSARDMGEFVAAADRLRQACGACVLPVHHEPRAGENLRGSTALEGAAATLIRISKDGPHLQADNTKQKDAAEFDPIRLRLVPRLDSAVIQSHDGVGLELELSASEQAIIDTLRDSFGTDGAPGSRLFDVAAVAKTSYYRALNRLVTAGAVVNIGSKQRTHYVLAEDAQSHESQPVPASPTGPGDSQSQVPHPYRGGTSGTRAETGRGEGEESRP